MDALIIKAFDVGFPLVGKAREFAIVSLLNPFISFVSL